MEYRKLGDTIYVRGDRGDELVSSILDICRAENILSATFSGIGGCQSAELQTFNPETSSFATERIEGMLELVSYTGNVICDEAGELHHHTHALFCYVEDGHHKSLGGHLKSTTVLYTAEIELRPVQGGSIGYRRDPETGTGFWAF
jgi:predicted DNA-binding protein with PD1-like motif